MREGQDLGGWENVAGSEGARQDSFPHRNHDEDKRKRGAVGNEGSVVGRGSVRGPAARERAVVFCDQLVRRFWARFEFDVSWWSFAMLEQAAAAKEAAEKAARADLIVFSAAPEGDFPPPVKAWIETWLSPAGRARRHAGRPDGTGRGAQRLGRTEASLPPQRRPPRRDGLPDASAARHSRMRFPIRSIHTPSGRIR